MTKRERRNVEFAEQCKQAAIERQKRAHTTTDDGMLGPDEFDAEAGRDLMEELDYIRSGQEKRNCGC